MGLALLDVADAIRPIRRPRWSERPTTLVAAILGNIRNFEAGAGMWRFARGREEAAEKERGRFWGTCGTGRRRPTR